MWRAWRVVQDEKHADRRAGPVLDTPGPTTAALPWWTVTLSAAARARVLLACSVDDEAARGPGGAMNIGDSVTAPELVYVPPLAWRALIHSCAYDMALVTYEDADGGLQARLVAARKSGAGSRSASAVAALERWYRRTNGLMALGDLVWILRITVASATLKWPASTEDLRSLFGVNDSAVCDRIFDFIRAPIAPELRVAATAAAAGPVDSVYLPVRAIDWRTFLHAFTNGRTVAPYADSAAAVDTATLLLRAQGVATSDDPYGAAQWFPGAVLITERLLHTCDALAWSRDLGADAAAQGGASGSQLPEPVAPLVEPVGDLDVAQLYEWLRSDETAAQTLRALHAAALARMGVHAVGDDITSPADAHPGGRPWTMARDVPTAAAGYRANRASQVAETRAFMRAVGTMCLVDAALGSEPMRQMDAASALFVWLVQNAIFSILDVGVAKILPIQAVEAHGADAAAAAAAAAAPAGSQAAQMLAQVQAAVRSASPWASVIAGAHAEHKATGDTVQVCGRAVAYLIVWHAAFLRALRAPPHGRPKGAMDPLAPPSQDVAGGVHSVAALAAADAYAAHFAPDGAAQARARDDMLAHIYARARPPRWVARYAPHAATLSRGLVAPDTDLRRYYVAAILCAFANLGLRNPESDALAVIQVVAGAVAFTDTDPNDPSLGPAAVLRANAQNVVIMNAFPLPLAYESLAQ